MIGALASLEYTRDGAQLYSGATENHLPAIFAALVHMPGDRAGVRISGNAALRPLIAPDGPIGTIATSILGLRAVAVRAILFDKSAETNWSLTWHQDRTICVRRRLEIEGFGPWTIKQGLHHVAPPFDLLSRMVTLRVHLDDVPEANAPLLVAPGSHCAGLVTEANVAAVVRSCGVMACLAKAGDVWLYATPILHASEAAAVPARRRLLQLDYAAEALPGGLEWLGV